MRIGDDYLNTVAFLFVDEVVSGSLKRIPKATAFYVQLAPGQSPNPVYVVTARHCIQEAGEGTIYLRVSTKDGFEDMPSIAEDWILDDTNDVAVSLFQVPPAGIVFSAVPTERFIEADYRYLGGELRPVLEPSGGAEVATGNDVFFVGLFAQHSGRARNLPIARFGQIARMPSEPVSIRRRNGTVERLSAYLVEARSWGGHSGSPVFWRQPTVQLHAIPAPPGMGLPDPTPVSQPSDLIAFLGLVSAHYDIDVKATPTGDVLGEIWTAINAGIAVVTPAEAVRQLLFREDVVEQRDKLLGGDEHEPAATPDTAGQDETSDFERFEDLTRKLVNTPKKEIDEKRKGES